ncbi:helix-turn-helix transcriptional regulator [Candidatus Falkowbacteria bacterium]|nr:helix-turn-helix transcriptional regulator [Candidatus Falkowbacteria bacterium]
MKNKNIKAIDLDSVLEKKLKNKKFKEDFDEYGLKLSVSYEIIKLRKARKMSQALLAEKIGTTQSNIARFEAGHQNFSLNFLGKVAKALESELIVSFKS